MLSSFLDLVQLLYETRRQRMSKINKLLLAGTSLSDTLGNECRSCDRRISAKPVFPMCKVFLIQFILKNNKITIPEKSTHIKSPSF